MALYDDIVADRAEVLRLEAEQEAAHRAYKDADEAFAKASAALSKVRQKYNQRVSHMRKLRGDMKCYCTPEDSNIHSKNGWNVCMTCGSTWEERR